MAGDETFGFASRLFCSSESIFPWPGESLLEKKKSCGVKRVMSHFPPGHFLRSLRCYTSHVAGDHWQKSTETLKPPNLTTFTEDKEKPSTAYTIVRINTPDVIFMDVDDDTILRTVVILSE
ncbi:hypothetical protein RUM44_002475 [Polyplax serrata]|uniref:Uncharacterized protein n=1 Tax=Polyplax serrata TaxID=468196 RepID=A0ABR1AG82_POLSC